MDHWQSSQAFEKDFKYRDSNRILASTSGNVQLYPASGKHDGTKQQSFQYPTTIASHIRGQRQHPIPALTLGSNDQRALARRKLLQNSIRRRMNIAKPYLAHPLYQKYRNRARKDVDKEGNTIWSDSVENAFQNAIVHIPPMGKNKRSQHGRPHGRNELIAEWIRHETGGEERGRKQVSSHLQVLEKMFKGVPEWQAFNKKTDDPSPVGGSNSYYSDSIADMVAEVMRMQRAEQEQLGFTGTIPERIHLDKIEFNMWVGLPQRMDNAIHRYTRLKPEWLYNQPLPLESIYDWRSDFPDLITIVDTMSASGEFDIAMLDVGLSLMEDFPPESSKLGINLGISYAEVVSKAGSDNADQLPWICTTQMYRQGKVFRTTQESKCLVSEPHTIKPPFESKWWAQEFTMLTDLRRRAQENADKGAPADADEFAANYLRDLTIMQQISMDSGQSGSARSIWPDGNAKQRRVTVLLWKFSFVPSGQEGTTIWHRVVPPPNRTTTNSPWPTSHQLPPAPMTLDSTMQDVSHHAYQGIFDGHNVHSHTGEEEYDPSLDEEFCQDGYANVGHGGRFDTNPISPAPITGQEYGQSLGFGMNAHYGIGLPTHDFDGYGKMRCLQSEMEPNTHEKFQPKIQPYYQTHLGMYQPPGSQVAISQGEAESHDNRQYALQTFNSATHEILQEQLRQMQMDRTHDHGSSQSVSTSERSRMESLGAATDHSNMSQTTAGSAVVDTTKATEEVLASPATLHANLDIGQIANFAAPIAVRPPFQQHHGFGGIFPPEPNLVVDTPRHDFARMLENMEAHHEGLFDMTQMMGLEEQEPFTRSYSQPTYAALDSRGQDVFAKPENAEGV